MDAFDSEGRALQSPQPQDDRADSANPDPDETEFRFEPNPAVPLNGNARRKPAVNWGAGSANGGPPPKPDWARDDAGGEVSEEDMESFLDDIDALRDQLGEGPEETIKSAPPVQPAVPPPAAPQPNTGLAPDEVATPVMLYTARAIVFGQLVTNKNLLPGRLLLGVHIPEFISLQDARRMPLHGGRPGKPQSFREVHIPSNEIIAFHLMPPHHEPPDYDLAEQNRVMRPVTVIAGDFHFNGHLRMAAQSTLRRFLESAKSEFVSLYETRIVNPTAPDMQPLEVPAALVRRTAVGFGTAS